MMARPRDRIAIIQPIQAKRVYARIPSVNLMTARTNYDREHDQDRDEDHFTIRDVVASYNAGAPTLAPGYECLPFEEVHAPVLDLLPDQGACVLDMGAGSGRDAAWFAANGYKVVAAEPAAEMRAIGKALHHSPDIRWMDDSLPALEKVLRSKLTFDLIWLSAEWMHVPRSARARAFRKLVSVMSPGGSMMLALRQGPAPADRPMEPATAADVEPAAQRPGGEPEQGGSAAGGRGPGTVPILDTRVVEPGLSPRHRPQEPV